MVRTLSTNLSQLFWKTIMFGWRLLKAFLSIHYANGIILLPQTIIDDTNSFFDVGQRRIKHEKTIQKSHSDHLNSEVGVYKNPESRMNITFRILTSNPITFQYWSEVCAQEACLKMASCCPSLEFKHIYVKFINKYFLLIY